MELACLIHARFYRIDSVNTFVIFIYQFFPYYFRCHGNDIGNYDINNNDNDHMQGEDYRFELLEILSDGLLYNDFLGRLKATMCAESLLCVRMITIFKDLLASKSTSKRSAERSTNSGIGIILRSLSSLSGLRTSFKSELITSNNDENLINRRISFGKIPVSPVPKERDVLPPSLPPVDKMLIITKAWEIYSYFIAHGASFEIPLAPQKRITIMRQLGNPKENMFDQLMSIAMRDLNFSFQKYKETENYRSMNKRALHNAVMIQSVEAGTGGSMFVRVRRAAKRKIGRVHAIHS